MAFPKPKDSKKTINRAGKTLLMYITDSDKQLGNEERRALVVLSRFRSCHGYPINTFQSTLRNRLRSIDGSAFVMQRLKRLPSIVMKLGRFKKMQLVRMQDIGGVRAVTSSIKKARLLEKKYLHRGGQFKHMLHKRQDYIKNPKPSGYRSIHLVYKYKNPRVPEYDGLFVELQIRTCLQHYWATAVETMGTYLEHSLKSSEGPKKWLDFFSLTGSAFAHMEKTPPVPGYEDLTDLQTYHKVHNAIKSLNIFNRLSAFTIATKHVISDKKRGAYHLLILDLEKKIVRIHSYPKSDLKNANKQYITEEHKANQNEALQVVLVSTGSIENLKKAYPNYFLDTRKFIEQLKKIVKKVK